MIRYLTAEEKPLSRDLWEEAFPEDSRSFDDYYYSEKIKGNRILALYGEEPDALCGRINHARDELEKRIFDMAWEKDKAVFGICRGLQVLNVFLGGTLYQDLPSQYAPARDPSTGMVDHHMRAPYDRVCHQVDILRDTPLHRILGRTKLGVNSYHHQGIKALAPGLRVMAAAEDGLVEGVYAPDKRYIQAVQWHPEFMGAGDTDAANIFEGFIKGCV